MFKNFLKVAFRNLTKDKLYSFVNITGLVIGITSCMFIFLYIQNELSYDKFNEKADRIYRLTEILHLPKENNARAVTSPPMAPLIQATFPEVQKSVRINYSNRILSYKDTKIIDTKIIYADSTLFDVFTFPMIKGNLHKALVDPYSIVLTENAAKKYFGSESAIGKIMKLSDTVNLTVTGIIKNVPVTSHFSFDCVLSHATIFEMNNQQPEDGWFNNGYYTYLLLPKNYPYQQLESKINTVIAKAMADERKKRGLWYDFKLQPLTDIHLKSKLNAEINPNSDIMYIYIFSVAAILILLIACCNFINLSTARSINRSKEIGLRKVVGANRIQLIIQFLGESFVFAAIAGILAFGLVMWLLPSFNSFTGKSLSINYFTNPTFFLIYAAIIMIVGLLAGAYPAFLMSSFGPIKALKGNIKHGWQDIFLRKGLVILQFTIAIILILGTTLVFEQLRFIQNQKLGLNKDQVLELPIQSDDLSKSEALINDLRKNRGVENVSVTNFSFKEELNSIAVLPEGASENEITSQPVITADEKFLPTFQIQLLAGRNFSKSFPTDEQQAFIVNEAAVKTFGWKTPQNAIGKNIDWGLGKKGKVIGVIKDFNFASLHDNIKPLIVHILPEWNAFVAVRVKPQGLPQTLKALESDWKKIAVNSPFEYSFLSDDFAELYKSEQNLQSILSLFTTLAIVVASLGLFGLAAFTIKQRFKEIGVRKVLGASVINITSLLSKDFLKLVMVAILIASPIAWFGMNKWLEEFAYRINISWIVFVTTGVFALLIAFATVSWLAIKAAVANPVKSLRTE